MHWKPLGVSEVRGQMASGGQTMGQTMWTRKLLGSNHVGTGVAGGQRGSKHVDTGVARGQTMVKACGHGSRWGSAGVKACGGWGQRGSKHVDMGVAGGQIMVNACGTGVTGGQRQLVGVSGGQIMLTREWLGIWPWSGHSHDAIRAPAPAPGLEHLKAPQRL